ncbi:MAG: SRPBCC family protein [Caulobacteraceae bacterium]
MMSSDSVPDDARKHKADRDSSDAVAVRAVTIGLPRDQVFAFFRDFTNLARFMENIERIDVLDAKRSHWVVKAPAGHLVEWDSVLTEERPGSLLAWESAPGADVVNRGRVEFRDAPPGPGTELHATLIYEPPAGALGKLIATLFQHEPGQQAKRDLRRLKMLLETGEIATTAYPDAAPRYKKADASEDARQAETR